MNLEVKKYISNELSKLLMGKTVKDEFGNTVTWVRATPNKIYWSIWNLISQLHKDKEIDNLNFAELMDKLVVFTEYITFA